MSARAAVDEERRVVARGAGVVDEKRDRAVALQALEGAVGRDRTRVLGHRDAGVGDGAQVVRDAFLRIRAVRVHRELDALAERRAHLGDDAQVGVAALPALQLERAQAVPRAQLGRLRRHQRRRLARDDPREGHFGPPSPLAP
jgi:hypothetical protein